MRCKKHTTDVTSITGVCASCLRDRLLKLIAAQEEAAQSESQSLSENNKSIIPPFPTSVSPYITRRKSDTSISHVQRPSSSSSNKTAQSDNQRVYNSPQIAFSTAGCRIGTTSTNNHHNNKKLVKFATFQNLFRSNNNTNTPIPMTSSSPSSRIKNHHHHQRQRQRCVRNRGMSPVRLSDDDNDDDGSSEYESIDTNTTSSSSCKQTPIKTIRRGGNKSVSEKIFCLSPLVRANPNRLWKGKPAVDGTSDVRIPVVPKLAYTKSFCANRSRKLADFGRPDPNR